MTNDGPITSGRFDIARISASLPASADTLLVDQYLTKRTEASARVFRVYRATPPHYHATCDEYLYVFSGRAPSGWATHRPRPSSGPASSCSSRRGLSTRCQTSSRSHSCSSRSIHRGATRRTSSTTTLPRAPPKRSSEPTTDRDSGGGATHESNWVLYTGVSLCRSVSRCGCILPCLAALVGRADLGKAPQMLDQSSVPFFPPVARNNCRPATK
jgi:hypothetical protein